MLHHHQDCGEGVKVTTEFAYLGWQPTFLIRKRLHSYHGNYSKGKASASLTINMICSSQFLPFLHPSFSFYFYFYFSLYCLSSVIMAKTRGGPRRPMVRVSSFRWGHTLYWPFVSLYYRLLLAQDQLWTLAQSENQFPNEHHLKGCRRRHQLNLSVTSNRWT